MEYFNRIETIEELKSEYRRLALENHPDKGGKTETMQEINAEFDLSYRILEKKVSRQAINTESEAPDEYRHQFYTANGWAGSRFTPGLGLRDIASIIRGYVKDVYPSWKFSITKENYRGLYVSLMEAPVDIFTEDGIRQWAKSEIWKRRRWGTEEQVISKIKEEIANDYIQNWDWYYDYMSDRAREVLGDIVELVNSYRFDDSDAMYDYYNTNFHPNFYIGKWKKPLKIVPKKERIQTSQGPEKVKRIVG